MKIIFSSLVLSLFIAPVAKSQAIEQEHWSDKPSLQTLDSKYQNEAAVITMDTRRVEFIDDNKSEVRMYYTMHRIVHVNNDHGIEYFNKVYIPTDDVVDVKEIHARAILSSGKIVQVTNDNIKDIKDEDGRSYKIFAIEGLEKGSEVEYYYTVERNTSYFGREQFQHTFPVLSSTLDLVFPQRLIFELKPYNCQPTTKTDSIQPGKTVMHVSIPELVGADDEKYSSYRLNLSRIEYKLSYNNATRSGQRLFTWNELAKKVYGIYSSISPKETSRIGDFVKDRGWARLSEDSAKVIAVENYIKNNFAYRVDIDASDIEKILKNKIASMIGLMRMYSAIFNELHVNYQFVLTTDKDNLEIDKSFENWDNCQYALFYFPSLKGYLVPSKPECRYPLIYPDWGGGNALFCKNVSIGSMTSAIAEVKPIALEEFNRSYNNLDISIKLNENLDSLLVDSRSIFGGYSAIYYREPFTMATEEQRKDIFKSMSKNQLNTETIVLSELENLSYEDANKAKPFIIHQVMRSGDLVERAGQKVLVKIGLVIGPQVEMYQEKKRRTPIAISFPHFEERKIRFTIPAGYKVKNLDNLNMKQVYEENGVQTMGFVSSYELKDNVVEIHIMEDYRKTVYPISQYDQFVKIINQSSDFNKVVLVLEKK